MKTKSKSENETKLSLINQIEHVAITLKKSKLKTNFNSEDEKAIHEISSFLGCSYHQSILFSVIFQLSFKNADVSISDVANYLKCSPLRILERIKDIESLKKLRLISAQHSNFIKSGFNYQEYYIPCRVTDAIGKMDRQILFEEEKMELIPLLDKVYKLVEQRDERQLTENELTEYVDTLLSNNQDLKFIKKLPAFKLNEDERILYLFTCRETINGDDATDLNYACNKIWEDTSTRFQIKRNLVKAKSNLIKLDLLKLQDGIFRSDREIYLTEKSLDLLLGDDIDLVMNQDEKVKWLIPNDKIQANKLFFNQKENHQLDELCSILQPKNFEKIQNRLRKHGMPSGVSVLFHGFTGTGKTASTYQIAKKTGRDIFMVDISDTKSMWFGESEKKIKAVFEDYKKLLKKNQPVPILVFNEADAVFGKRGDVDKSAVGQTENAIQNIILQEMESFDGILIATTNLTFNFDKAFERRFLYKILFNKPEATTRAKIWKDKIPCLTQKQAGIIAEKFELTGGSIDNVARKITMNSVLYDKKSKQEEIMDYCQQETFTSVSKKPIGF